MCSATGNLSRKLEPKGYGTSVLREYSAGKTRSLAVLLDGCELDNFSAVIYTKENVAAKALADQISDLSPPTFFFLWFGRFALGTVLTIA